MEKIRSTDKASLIRETVNFVKDLCALVFNIKTDDQLEKVFGATETQLKNAIEKVINALPDYIFNHACSRLLEEIKNICAREFIFFQVQEKWNDTHYQEHLQNFAHVFSRDMQQRIDTFKNYSSKSKEE